MQRTLEALAGTSAASPIQPPKRRWIARAGIPLGVAAGTLAVLAVANRDSLLPSLPVRTASVAVAAASSTDTAAAAPTVSVQAPGWIEPDPHPIYVTALADGIVEELLVLEGDRVSAGQVVARLVSEDAELAVARAEAVLARRNALLTAAETEWSEPVALERAVAVSKAALDGARAQQAVLRADVAVQAALLAEAEAVYKSVLPLSGDAAPEVEVATAQLKRDALRAAHEAAGARLNVVAAQIERLEAELNAANRDLELRVEHRQRLDESRAAVAEAEADLDTARLRLRRMNVVSPAAGTVMDRLVAPGAKVRQAMDGLASAHIVHLYNPARLQVRVDVPLADAAKIQRGQPARIVADVLPDTEFSGQVTRFVHQADISKNTVQVKVAIDAPSPHVKPDMLARVKFLSHAQTADGPADGMETTGLRVFVPPEALVDDASAAWVVDTSGQRVRRRTVMVGPGRRMGWVEIAEGLKVGDVVVASPTEALSDGRRVRVIAQEDRP